MDRQSTRTERRKICSKVNEILLAKDERNHFSEMEIDNDDDNNNDILRSLDESSDFQLTLKVYLKKKIFYVTLQVQKIRIVLLRNQY